MCKRVPHSLALCPSRRYEAHTEVSGHCELCGAGEEGESAFVWYLGPDIRSHAVSPTSRKAEGKTSADLDISLLSYDAGRSSPGSAVCLGMIAPQDLGEESREIELKTSCAGR